METELRTKKRKQSSSSIDPDLSLRNPKNLIEEAFNNGEPISRTSIKDLRARRVFSPASFSNEKGNVGGGSVVEDPKLQFDVELCSEDQKNSGNTTENSISCVVGVGDGDVFCKSKQKTNLSLENTSRERGSSNGRSGVLIPCLRKKLFKAPNSLGYRRLLPFLMEIEKDNYDVLGISPCQKVEKSEEERLLPSLSASARHIPIDGANTELLPVGRLCWGSEALPTSRTSELTHLLNCPNSESPEQSITESAIQKPPENSFSPLYDPMIMKPPDSYTESASQDQQYISDRSSVMEPTHEVIGSSRDGGAEIQDTNLQFKVELCLEVQKNSGNTENSISCGAELLQTTPPDDDVFCKLQQKTDLVLENTSSEGVSGNGSRVDEGDKHNQSNTTTRSGVLFPCSRMKLFKAPNSFSYRRLLPFLMEIEKDTSNVLGNSPCQKVEKSVEEKPLPSLSTSPAQQIPIDRADTKLLPVGCLSGDLEARQTSMLTEIFPHIVSSNFYCPNLESPEQPIREPAIQKSPKTSFSPVHDSIIIKTPNSYTESASQVQQEISDKSSKMEPAHDVIGSVHVRGAEIEDTNLQLKVEPCLEDKKTSGNTENSNSCGGEWFQTTPPDSDIFCKSKPKTDLVLGNISSERVFSNGSCVSEGEKHHQSSPKTRLGMNIPCSRMKLFKTPGSFSYRRLLPFLLAREKDNSNVLGISPCQKVEKIVEDRTRSLLPASTAQHIPTDGANMEVLPVGHPFEDPGASPTPKSIEMTPLIVPSNIYCPTSELPITESAIQNHPETSISPFYDSTIMMPPDSYAESKSRVQLDTLDKSSKLGPDHDVKGTVHETNLPVKALSIKEGSLEGNSHLSAEAEDRATLVPQLETDAKPLEELNLHQDSPYINALSSFEKPFRGATKGILKRYPRGCRGLCNCLNCASFILHAERAFEFSKSQMQDAEEVTVGLMKELSYLRNLLEKSVDGAESHAIPSNQVKGACRKASKAEELAKNRLKQMNQELNIHCRTTCLQRPRVRFADHTEMLIPITDTCQGKSWTNETEDSG